ncbi:hypothetical protein OsI_28707 [Oryza sativa Indica Group]|uniref:Uncharacterized protein n=1 Tax=Oryza sativa subsp. indica TaxID=39946 RepID=B8B9I0_ORYSI|nr:hypothetical protein OsI_28707 [Oryza sativa Indica Group]
MMICETWEIQMLTSMSPENLSIGHQVLAAEKALGKGKHLGDGRLSEPRQSTAILQLIMFREDITVGSSTVVTLVQSSWCFSVQFYSKLSLTQLSPRMSIPFGQTFTDAHDDLLWKWTPNAEYKCKRCVNQSKAKTLNY